MDLVEQTYWDNIYRDKELTTIITEDAINDFIKKNIPEARGYMSVFEIGCYPGNYLPCFGEKGYEINGIDLTPKVNELSQFLASQGYKVGRIERGNFFNEEFRQYDIVCSFGFIEHFINYCDVIKMQLDMVKPGGYVLIETPNFRGLFQYLYHRVFDNLNLKRHNILSMNPNEWSKIAKMNGFTNITTEFIGNIIWKEEPLKRIFIFKYLEIFITKLIQITSSIKATNSLSGSYTIMLAQKIT